MRTKVLIVDDSALVRNLLTEILSQEPTFEVVGAAQDPFVARTMIKELNPDVLTLDVEMPRMDGVTFLKNLMRLRPMPVVMVSSLTEQGADVTLEALDCGAIDFVTKPKLDLAQGLEQYAGEIIAKVKTAAAVRNLDRFSQRATAAATRERPAARNFKTTDAILAIGGSTGGTEAIREVVSALPPDTPGVVIAQHIPRSFSGPFANRLDEHSAIKIKEATDGEQVLPGHGYVAPGDDHLRVVRDGARYVCRVRKTEPVNRHRPSVDVLFDSVAEHVGQNAVGVLLTGMGADGAEGLLRLLDAGAATIAQDEATSVVWGMPGSAVKLGAAEHVLPLGRVAGKVLEILEKR
jgi:two-component system chemotaxis response regulator CheB